MGTDLIEYRAFPVQLARWDVEVTYIRTSEDVFYFPLRQLCDAMGISYTSQLSAIKADHAYEAEGALIKLALRTAGGPQEVWCLRKRETAWWIGHINPKRCRITVRGPLEDFQRDLMAEADRLLFGNLTGVPGDALVKAGRPVYGHVDLGLCPRCAANLALVIDPEGTRLEIMEEGTI